MKKLFFKIIIFGLIFKIYATSKSENLIKINEWKSKKENRNDPKNVKYNGIFVVKSKPTNDSLEDRNLSKLREKSVEYSKSSQKIVKQEPSYKLENDGNNSFHSNGFISTNPENIERNITSFDKAMQVKLKPLKVLPTIEKQESRRKKYSLSNGQSRDSERSISDERKNFSQLTVSQPNNLPNKFDQSDYKNKNEKLEVTAFARVHNLSDADTFNEERIKNNNILSAELSWDSAESYPDYVSVGFELFRRNSRYLKRITVLNSRGITIYDTLIYPNTQRTDFNEEIQLASQDLGLKINQYLTVRTKVAKLIEGKLLVGYKVPSFLKSLKLFHSSWMIRDVYTLTKYTDIFLTENKDRKLSYFEYLYLGRDITTRSISSFDKAETSANLYRKFRKNWEIEVNILAKRPGTQLNQVIQGTYEDLPIPSGVRYIGFHCDTSKYLPTYQKLPADIVALNVEGTVDNSYYRKFQWRRVSIVGPDGGTYYDTMIYPYGRHRASNQSSVHIKPIVRVREEMDRILSKSTIIVGFGILGKLDPIISTIKSNVRIYDLETYAKELGNEFKEFKVDTVYKMARRCLHTDFMKELHLHESECLLQAKIALQIFSLYRFDTNNLLNPFVIGRDSTLSPPRSVANISRQLAGEKQTKNPQA